MSWLLIPILLLSGIGNHPAHAAQTDYVTRAEAVMFLLAANRQDVPVTHTERPVFADTAAGSWQERYLRAAVQRGMVTVDTGNGAVYPDAPVRREEYLWMLVMLFGLPPREGNHFADAPASRPYAAYASHVALCNLFPLADPTRFEPDRFLTFQEASAALTALWRCFPPIRPLSVSQSPPRLSFAARLPSSAAPIHVRSVSLLPSKTELSRLQIISLVNQQRKKADLPLLVRSEELDQAAQAYARDMYKRGYFSHFSPEGLNYVDRIRASGYLALPTEQCPCRAQFDMSEFFRSPAEATPHTVVTRNAPVCNCTPQFALGENIARGQPTPDAVVEQWMDSESHRNTILQPLFRETGVGIFGDVWVQEYGALSLE